MGEYRDGDRSTFVALTHEQIMAAEARASIHKAEECSTMGEALRHYEKAFEFARTASEQDRHKIGKRYLTVLTDFAQTLTEEANRIREELGEQPKPAGSPHAVRADRSAPDVTG